MVTDSRSKQAITQLPLDIWVKLLILLMVVGSFIVMLYPSLMVQEHHYKPGDIAERDIKATLNFFIEDKSATENSRVQAVDQVLTVYDLDPRLGQELGTKVRTAFKTMRQFLTDLEKDQFVDQNQNQTISEGQLPSTETSFEHELMAQKVNFENQIGLSINQGAYALLINEQFAPYIADLIVRILNEILGNGVVANKEVLLKESEKGITLRNVVTQTEKTVLALRQFHGPDQAKTMVRIVAEPLVKDLDYNIVNLVVDLCQRLLQPNITLNRNETEERKKKILETIKPVMYQIKAGEMILREGERVTDLHILKLQAMTAQTGDNKIVTTSLGAGVLLAILLLAVHTLY
jgi:membrane-associated HD superfamily phosphohydrolase